MIIYSIKMDKLSSTKRFEPKYHYNKKILDNIISKTDVFINLGDSKILRSISDGEHAGQTFIDIGVKFIKNSDVRDFVINTHDNFYISEEAHAKNLRSQLKYKDLLFTTIGHVGSCAIVPMNIGEANINQNLVKLEIDDKYISPFYLAAFLNSKFARLQIESLTTGNIHKLLSYPKLKKIKVYYPDFDFQNIIQSLYLEKLEYDKSFDELINEVNSIVEDKLSEFRTSYGKKYFGININEFGKSDIWTPKFFYPDYNLYHENLRNNFSYFKIGKEFEISRGNEIGSDEYINFLNKNDGDVPFIRTTDIVNYSIDSNPDNFCTYEIASLQKNESCSGDLLFTKDGKIGNLGIITNEDSCVLSSGIGILKGKKNAKVSTFYLFAILNNPFFKESWINKYVVFSSTIPHLKEHQITEFEIPMFETELYNLIVSKIKTAFIYKDNAKKIQKRIINLIDKKILDITK